MGGRGPFGRTGKAFLGSRPIECTCIFLPISFYEAMPVLQQVWCKKTVPETITVKVLLVPETREIVLRTCNAALRCMR